MAESTAKAVLLIGVFVVASTGWAATPPAAATVTSIVGAVGVKRSSENKAIAGAAAALSALHVNDSIFSGDIVFTTKTGAAKLLFADDSIIDLGPSSSFKVDAFAAGEQAAGDRSATFSLLYGRLRALVTKAITPASKFEVKTPTASMGVRGTEFIVNAPRGLQGVATAGSERTDVVVVSGEVKLANPRTRSPEVSLKANTGATTSSSDAGAAPLPRVFTDAEMAQITSSARVQDNTFLRTISADSGVRNERAPAQAAPIAVATQAVAATTAKVSKDADTREASNSDSRSQSILSVLNMLNDTPVQRIPGTIQTIKVRLSP